MKFRKPWWVDEYLEFWARSFILCGPIGMFMFVTLKPYFREDANPTVLFYQILALFGLGIVLYVILCVIKDPCSPNRGDDGTE